MPSRSSECDGGGTTARTGAVTSAVEGSRGVALVLGVGVDATALDEEAVDTGDVGAELVESDEVVTDVEDAVVGAGGASEGSRNATNEPDHRARPTSLAHPRSALPNASALEKRDSGSKCIARPTMPSSVGGTDETRSRSGTICPVDTICSSSMYERALNARVPASSS